jgi:hypothetical protein
MPNRTLTIDPEFKNIIPPLTPEEKEQLKFNLIRDGCIDPLLVWDGVIVDGHNRYEICTRNDIPYNTKDLHFDSREDAIDWIINNQLGRRNISDMQRSYLRGLQYEREKKRRGADTGNENASKNKPEKVADLNSSETAERLAGQHKVSTRTIYSDAQFVKALDTVSQNVGGDITQKVLTKEIKTTKADVVKAASLTPEQQKDLFKDTSRPIRLKKDRVPSAPNNIKDNHDVDFSFLVVGPEETEEDKEFDSMLNKMASGAEMMSQLIDVICVPIVADYILKSLKSKLLEFPDTSDNADDPDRKAFVNAFNILKKIIRKEG